MELLLGKWTPSSGDTTAGAAAGDTIAGAAAGDSDKSCSSHLTACCM